VHNHPSGVTNPSAHDKSLAGRIQEGAKLLSLEFTDFVIVGASGYFLFVEKGLMANGT
jgi:DNA repair protein RadC